MAQVTLKGNPVPVDGQLPQVGQQAPAFSLVGKDLGDVTLASLAGKRKVLNIFPSVDTPTCATSVRKFNAEAAQLLQLLASMADSIGAGQQDRVEELLEPSGQCVGHQSPRGGAASIGDG